MGCRPISMTAYDKGKATIFVRDGKKILLMEGIAPTLPLVRAPEIPPAKKRVPVSLSQHGAFPLIDPTTPPPDAFNLCADLMEHGNSSLWLSFRLASQKETETLARDLSRRNLTKGLMRALGARGWSARAELLLPIMERRLRGTLYVAEAELHTDEDPKELLACLSTRLLNQLAPAKDTIVVTQEELYWLLSLPVGGAAVLPKTRGLARTSPPFA
ncbi:MAG: hypothetical protein ACP5UI_00380 [Thermoprotei archaeon]|nr:hypothetical protein [TACK group archaeon]